MASTLTIAHSGTEFGVYRQQDDGTHLLVTTGHDAVMLGAVRAVAEPGATVVEVDAPHLRVGGQWQAQVSGPIEASTPQQQVRAAIASIEEEARRRMTEAADLGSRSDNGVGRLAAKAEGMREAYAILTGEDLPVHLPL